MEEGMQPPSKNTGPEAQASAEGNRRLDLVDRLRDRSYMSKAKDPLCEEAADEIERLRLKVHQMDMAAHKRCDK